MDPIGFGIDAPRNLRDPGTPHVRHPPRIDNSWFKLGSCQGTLGELGGKIEKIGFFALGFGHFCKNL